MVELGDGSIGYERWTLAGTAGGPSLDLASGRVIGVHVGGHYGEKRGVTLGFGVLLSAIVGEPIADAIREVDSPAEPG